jgi:20S proteasome subunit beta 3
VLVAAKVGCGPELTYPPLPPSTRPSRAQSILEQNGSGVVAMCGKNCVAIASDTRLGVSAQTIATDFQRLFKINDKLFIGMSGLGTDVQTIAKTLEFKMAMYRLKEQREMKPRSFAQMITTMLYEKRFGPYFVEPVIAGLEKVTAEDGTVTWEPYLTATDLIGAGVLTDDFVVAGTCSENLYGTCETLFRPDLSPDDLFETVAQVLLASMDRDALSGWGGVVHIITAEGITTRTLKARQD